MSSWAKDMQDANALFSEFITKIGESIRGELISTELEGGRLADIFDKYAGIDAIHVWNQQVRGVAVRIQWEKENYRTFTIRYKRHNGTPTEYAKRMSAINGDTGALYPYLTIQAYATKRNGGKLRSYAIVRTKDLYNYISSRLIEINGEVSGVRSNKCPEGNTFIYVSFDELKQAGLPCVVRDFEANEIYLKRADIAATLELQHR